MTEEKRKQKLYAQMLVDFSNLWQVVMTKIILIKDGTVI